MAEPPLHGLDGVEVLEQHALLHHPGGLKRDLGRDEWVAVAVAAHPRAEAQRHRIPHELHRSWQGAEHPSRLSHQLRDGVPEDAVEDVEKLSHLLDDRGTAVAQLVALPQGVDVHTGLEIDGVALGVRVGVVAKQEQLVQARELVLRGAALALGGVGGEDWAQLQLRESLRQVLWADSVFVQRMHRRVERAELRGRTHPCVMTAAANPVGLLRHVHEPEVEAERADDRLGARQLPGADKSGDLLAVALIVTSGLAETPELLDVLEHVGAGEHIDGTPESSAEASHVVLEGLILRANGGQLGHGREGSSHLRARAGTTDAFCVGLNISSLRPAWLDGYSRQTLAADLTAGVTVAVMLVPQAMAYAMLAVGSVALVSLLTATAVGAIAASGTEASLEAAILLALMVGVMQVAMGFLRLGYLVNVVNHSELVTVPHVLALRFDAAFYCGNVTFGRHAGASRGGGRGASDGSCARGSGDQCAGQHPRHDLHSWSPLSPGACAPAACATASSGSWPAAPPLETSSPDSPAAHR